MSGGPLTIPYEYVPEEEYKKREKKLRQEMEKRKLDLLLLYGDEYRYGDSLYIANYKGGNLVEEAPYVVFFPLDEAEKPVFFTGRFNAQTARVLSRIKDVRAAYDIDKELRDITRGKSKKYRRVGFTAEYIMPLSIFEMIKAGLPSGAELEPVSDIMRNLRIIKTDGEVALMRKAAELADLGLKATEEALRPGRTCWEMIAIAENAVRMGGGDNLFWNAVGSGEETGDRIYAPSQSVVQDGKYFVLGLHPNYHFYCNDTERVWAVGKLPKEHEKVLISAGKVMEEVINYAKPGITYKDLIDKETELWREFGYSQYWEPYMKETLGKCLGHGIGLAVVEWPFQWPQDYDLVLQPNMVLALKSELHGFSWGGIRHETATLITKTGSEALNKFHYPLYN